MNGRAIFEAYRAILDAMLTDIGDDLDPVEQAAALAAAAIAGGHVIAVFGTGHSHLLAEEGFYRAGGLIPVLPVQVPCLMLHAGAAASTRMERLSGLAEAIYEAHRVEPGDLVIVASSSGRNAAPIEFALTAKARGNKVVALTSKAASAKLASRHASGKRLFEIADLVLDNRGRAGDAALDVVAGGPAMGPTSTIAGSFLLHLMFMRVAALLAEQGRDVPVLRSANLDDGAAEAEAALARWRHRIPF